MVPLRFHHVVLVALAFCVAAAPVAAETWTYTYDDATYGELTVTITVDGDTITIVAQNDDPATVWTVTIEGAECDDDFFSPDMDVSDAEDGSSISLGSRLLDFFTEFVIGEGEVTDYDPNNSSEEAIAETGAGGLAGLHSGTATQGNLNYEWVFGWACNRTSEDPLKYTITPYLVLLRLPGTPQHQILLGPSIEVTID